MPSEGRNPVQVTERLRTGHVGPDFISNNQVEITQAEPVVEDPGDDIASDRPGIHGDTATAPDALGTGHVRADDVALYQDTHGCLKRGVDSLTIVVGARDDV